MWMRDYIGTISAIDIQVDVVTPALIFLEETILKIKPTLKSFDLYTTTTDHTHRITPTRTVVISMIVAE